MTEAISKAYVTQVAALLDLPLAPEHLPGVAANFSHLGKTAELLSKFTCSPELEPAPIFEP